MGNIPNNMGPPNVRPEIVMLNPHHVLTLLDNLLPTELCYRILDSASIYQFTNNKNFKLWRYFPNCYSNIGCRLITYTDVNRYILDYDTGCKHVKNHTCGIQSYITVSNLPRRAVR